jgi:WXG100 family type VII secretion target
VDEIAARLEALERDLAPLADSWVGDAREAFVVAKHRWDAAITELHQVLHETSIQVTLANAEYRSADVRGARSFDL